MNEIKIQAGHALSLMKEIPDDSVALILCKIPHAVDGIYDLDEIEEKYPIAEFWEEAHRCLTPHGVVAVFGGQEPTTTWIRTSNLERYRYDWMIDFKHPFDHAVYKGKNVPLRRFEPVNIFSERNPRFFPNQLDPTNFGERGDCFEHDHEHEHDHWGDPEFNYHPQFEFYEFPHHFPENVLEVPHTHPHRVHFQEPGQYPLPLLEYLIKTYTVRGETVLDPFCGLGNTGLACIETNRSFIGIEGNIDLFTIARNRLDRGCLGRSSIFFDWEDRRPWDEIEKDPDPEEDGHFPSEDGVDIP